MTALTLSCPPGRAALPVPVVRGAREGRRTGGACTAAAVVPGLLQLP